MRGCGQLCDESIRFFFLRQPSPHLDQIGQGIVQALDVAGAEAGGPIGRLGCDALAQAAGQCLKLKKGETLALYHHFFAQPK